MIHEPVCANLSCDHEIEGEHDVAHMIGERRGEDPGQMPTLDDRRKKERVSRGRTS